MGTMTRFRVAVILSTLLMATLLLLAFLQVTGETDTALAQGDTYYVSVSENCGGAVPCYTSIQSAVDAALDGDTIKITQGVYTSTGFQVVYINKAITVTGGYIINNWVSNYPITQPTVIDAENIPRRRGVYIDGTSMLTITLDGLTILNGYAENANGGGIYILSGTIILQDNRIANNTAPDHLRGGGGVSIAGGTISLHNNLFEENSCNSAGGGLLIEGGLVTLEGNVFQSNDSGSRGGGLMIKGGVVDLVGNTIISNGADIGGGILLDGGILTATGNSFKSNTSDQSGGGVYTDHGISTFTGNDFRGNNAANNGGGIAIESDNATLTYNSFYTNSSGNNGGGIWTHYADTIFLTSNIVCGNSAGNNGGGIALSYNSTVDAQNNIVVNNISPSEGIYVADSTLLARHWTIVNNGNYGLTTNNGSVILTNTIISSHTVGGLSGIGISADHSLFFNSGTPCSSGATCTNSIIGDPIFINPTECDYHLDAWSAAVDQGVNAFVTEDIDGDPRPMRSSFDIGADEQSELPMASFSSSSPDWLGQTTDFLNNTYPFWITTYEWDLGDNTTSDLVSPTHSYSNPGQYIVILTGTNSAGDDTYTETVTIYGAPTAHFTGYPTDGIYPLEITFTNATNTDPPGDTTLTYLWDFGDGENSSQENPLHIYNEKGNYTVTLTASNPAGSDVFTRAGYITVYEPVIADFTANPVNGVAPSE